jgi:serine protease Do
MKTKNLVVGAACLSLPIFLAVSGAFLQPASADVKSSSSGSIQMLIDPSSPGFDAKKKVEEIRDMTGRMQLSDAQRKQLDSALEELEKKAKSGAEKFPWKFEFSSDGSTEGNSGGGGESSPRKKEGRSRQQQPAPFNMRDLMQEMQQNGHSADDLGNAMEQMMRDMMKGLGQDENPRRGGGGGAGGNPFQELMEQFRRGGGGGQQFRFEMGPDGKLRQNGGSKGNEDAEDSPRGRGGFNMEELLGGMGMGNSQFDPDSADRDSKFSRATLAEYRSVVKDARNSTVNILRKGKRVAMGIVVSGDGHILTVASELRDGSKLEIETMDGSTHPVEVLDKASQASKAYDVALLQVKDTKLPAMPMAEGELTVGTMVAAAGIDENPLSVGVISVGVRNLDNSKKPMLGVQMDEAKGEKGVPVVAVVPDMPADRSGILPEDIILSVNGVDTKTPDEVKSRVSDCRVGQTIKLRINRKGNEQEIEVKLASRKDAPGMFGEGPDRTAMMGSDLTRKSAEFPNAMTNDLGLDADQCGGPVVNIDGKMVGMNVARSGRTSTFMINNKVIKDLLSSLNTGKLADVIDPTTVDRDIADYEDQLKEAQNKLKELEESLKKAKSVKDGLKQ